MWRRNLIKTTLVFVLVAALNLSIGCEYTPPGEPEGRLLVILSRWGGGEEIPDEGYELLDLHGRRRDVAKTFGVWGVPSRPAVWSPSGDRLAYRGSAVEDRQSWIFDVDITAMTAQKYPLPEDGRPYFLTWSADGTSFLFIWRSDSPGPSEIWRLDRATQQVEVLSQLPAGVRVESWSPDRSQIAFVTAGTWVQIDPHNSRHQDTDLFIQNVDGTDRRMIYEDVTGVAWSPDGEYIAFTSITEWLELESQICWMPVKDGEAVCLQERGAGLTWSPDGERIAFVWDGIHVVDTRTRTVQTLVDLEKDEKGASGLDWSPDGKYLAYEKCYSKEAVDSCEIHVVSSDGKEHRRLTRNRFGDEFPIWQPITP